MYRSGVKGKVCSNDIDLEFFMLVDTVGVIVYIDNLRTDPLGSLMHFLFSSPHLHPIFHMVLCLMACTCGELPSGAVVTLSAGSESWKLLAVSVPKGQTLTNDQMILEHIRPAFSPPVGANCEM